MQSFIKAVRFLIGVAFGLAFWWFGTPRYNAVLCDAAQPLLRLDDRMRNVFLSPDGRWIAASGADLPNLRIPADQLTYNIVLLLGLYATLPIKRRTLIAFGLSIAVLALTHVGAVIASIQATLNRESVWGGIEYVYRLAGMFAIAFACWWVSSPGAFQDRHGKAREDRG